MLWILKKNIFTDGAVAIFNALHGNSNGRINNTGYSNKKSVSKNVAYNKLSTNDEFGLYGKNADTPTSKSSKFSCLGDSTNSDYDDDFTDDDSDYDESLTCNVCDRSFYNRRSLEAHQQKKRHFGCSACDTLFTTIMQLEHHKEEFDHWSDSETSALTSQNQNDDDDDFEEDDSYMDSGEELERLL